MPTDLPTVPAVQATIEHNNTSKLAKRRAVLPLLTSAVIGATLLPIPQALAQSQSAGGQLEEIIVTVRRRSEMATDVPMAITAMTPEMMENRGLTELTKLDTNIAGLNITTGGAGINTPLIALRGQRPSEVLLTHDPAVPLYFAEIVLTPTYGTNLSMYDLDNVQVLKGPQGTLFGRNSTGGAVLFTPKAPETEFGGYAKGTLGDYNLYKFEGAVNLPVNDVLGFRLSAQKTERDGYQSIVGDSPVTCNDCLWDEDSYGVRLVTSIDTGDLRNLTTLSYDDSDNNAKTNIGQAFNPSASLGTLWHIIHNGGLHDLAPGFAAAAGAPADRNIDDFLTRQSQRDPWDVELSVIPKETTENRFLANNTEFDLNDDLTIKNVFGYRYLEMTSIQDADGTPLPLFGSIQSDSPTVPDDVSVPSVRTILTEQFSNEIQLIGSTDDWDWIVGAYWFKMEGAESSLSSNVGPNPDWPTTAIPSSIWGYAQNGLYGSSSESSVLNTSYAIFGEGTYTFNDEWSMTLGLRQTWDEREITSNIRKTNDPASFPVCDVYDEAGELLQANSEPYSKDLCSRTEDEKFSSPTGRVAVNYNPNYGELYYGSISMGYRTGGFQTRGNDNLTLRPYDEETVLTYELGHKADWNSDTLGSFRTAVALYWQDYQDIQKTQGVTIDTQYVTTTINAAEAVIRGVDLDLMWAPTESLLFTMNYAYIDAYYKNWEREQPDGSFLDNSSSPFVYIPEHSLSATAQYTLPLDVSLGEISLIANVYWQTEQDTLAEKQHIPSVAASQGWSDQTLADIKGAIGLDAYELWSFRVNWKEVMGSSFDASLYVDNAFDEEYEDGGITAHSSLGWIAKTYGAPRTYGASLQWNF